MTTTGIGYKPEFAQIIKELEMIIDESVQNFMIHIDHQLDRLKKLQAYPMLYNRAQKSAETQIDIFMDTIKELFSDHRNNLRSKPFDER